MSENEWIIIKEESREQDARIVQGFLRSQGIESEINEDDAGDQFPSLEETQGVQIMVRPSDVEKAKALIAERETAASEETPDDGDA